SHVVQEAEGEGGTVIEKRPESKQAAIYRTLAKNIRDNSHLVVPTPVELEEVMELTKKYQLETCKRKIIPAAKVEQATVRHDRRDADRAAKNRFNSAAYGSGGTGDADSFSPVTMTDQNSSVTEDWMDSNAQPGTDAMDDKKRPAPPAEIYPSYVNRDWAASGRKKRNLRKIAIYGKGGIGKSTTSSNVSAALSRMGETVLQVGCDPKRDSIATLCGKLMPTILDTLRDNNGEMTPDLMESIVHAGYNGIYGIESGGPKPGVGCAGGGVMESLKLLEQFDILKNYNITFTIFDVLGDVVCGGFAQPMRAGYAKEVYIVACGEILTLLQINNIAKSIKKLHDRGMECGCAGIINNMRGIKNEEKIVNEIAEKMGLPVIMHIPRSQTVQDAEFYAQTVVQAYPESEQAQKYRKLAENILNNQDAFVPNPISLEEIKPIVQKYA
ncbi:AAA family ATPase, partial [candidate division KSB1 bacterium]|nr:AAA family ATPase [candidate division KSB1 bacterium]